MLLGAAHDACRHHLAGGDMDLDWMRATLPDAAWRSLQPATKQGDVGSST
jgi:hypothetical protein